MKLRLTVLKLHVLFIFLLLTGCAQLKFNSNSVIPGLASIGLELAMADCKKHNNYGDYQQCLIKVDRMYLEQRTDASSNAF